MAYVNLSNMPSPPKTRVSAIQNLRGGLNIHDMPWQINADQSPDMKNMMWSDGALRSRPGVTAYNTGAVVEKGDETTHNFTDIRAYGYAHHGWYVICNPGRGVFTALSADDPTYWVDIESVDGGAFPVEHTDGMFFMHNGVLFYKSVGGFYRITVGEQTDETSGLPMLLAENVEGYVPTTYINATPVTVIDEQSYFGGGDFYQPYNRMSLKRSIKYNCGADTRTVVIPEAAVEGSVKLEYVDASGRWIAFELHSVEHFSDRVVLQFTDDEGTLGAALTDAGVENVTNNVRVEYEVANTGDNAIQYNSIMGCNLVEVFGGNSGLCVVMAGYEGQPNAYFWSGNTDVAMDPTYFPAESYNLSGDFTDPITGFGKQQNMLVVFQKRQIGRVTYDTATVDGRTFITMNYTTISPGVGCDLPNTIQLIENNLVFCNSKYGVMFIKDTSSAYENNIVPISANVEKPGNIGGLFADIANTDPKMVLTFDDTEHYWLFANGHAWLWDYSLGGSVNDPKGLSWFTLDEMASPSCWFGFEHDLPWFFGTDGYLREFRTTLQDEADGNGQWLTRGDDFEKILTLPTQDFGTYEVLKNVDKVIFVCKGSGNNFIQVEYETDYETRLDPTPIYVPGYALAPRDLTKRNMLVLRFAATAIRRPRAFSVRHFGVRLKNNTRGDEIAFISAQIFYAFQGVDR